MNLIDDSKLIIPLQIEEWPVFMHIHIEIFF